MASYRKSPEAEEDLITIWLYIAEDNKAMATQFIDRLHGQMKDLALFPQMGRLREDLAPRLRMFPVGSHLIFYRELPEGIEVARVLNGRRDMRKLFE